MAGATGWAGSALARAIAQAQDITHVSSISRSHAQRILGEVLDEPRLGCPIYATASEALVHRCDVFVELTKPDVAKANVLAALQHGAQVVIGTSGLTDADYAEIAAVAEQHQRGVLAVGKFALTVVLLQKFADIAAQELLTLDFTFILRAPTRRVKRNISAKKAAAASPQNMGGDYNQIVNPIDWINICVNEKVEDFGFRNIQAIYQGDISRYFGGSIIVQVFACQAIIRKLAIDVACPRTLLYRLCCRLRDPCR